MIGDEVLAAVEVENCKTGEIRTIRTAAPSRSSVPFVHEHFRTRLDVDHPPARDAPRLARSDGDGVTMSHIRRIRRSEWSRFFDLTSPLLIGKRGRRDRFPDLGSQIVAHLLRCTAWSRPTGRHLEIALEARPHHPRAA
jgi:hypothetical protein